MENLELEFCTYNNVNKINKTIFWGGGGGCFCSNEMPPIWAVDNTPGICYVIIQDFCGFMLSFNLVANVRGN